MVSLAEIGAYEFKMDEYGRFKVVGVTDQFTTCCCCGRENLKKTAVMQDSEGNYSFFGTTCAANATRYYYSSKYRTRKLHKSFYDDLIAPTLKVRASKVV